MKKSSKKTGKKKLKITYELKPPGFMPTKRTRTIKAQSERWNDIINQ